MDSEPKVFAEPDRAAADPFKSMQPARSQARERGQRRAARSSRGRAAPSVRRRTLRKQRVGAGGSSVANGKKRAVNDLEASPARRVEGEPLKPIRKVMREIVRPDGTILRVEVPVYPPFKLKQRGESKG